MPGWLQTFASVQPVSVTVNAVRALSEGHPTLHWFWQSLAWTAGVLLVFVPLSVRQYRRLRHLPGGRGGTTPGARHESQQTCDSDSPVRA